MHFENRRKNNENKNGFIGMFNSNDDLIKRRSL
jgi:hypothetical protein